MNRSDPLIWGSALIYSVCGLVMAGRQAWSMGGVQGGVGVGTVIPVKMMKMLCNSTYSLGQPYLVDNNNQILVLSAAIKSC